MVLTFDEYDKLLDKFDQIQTRTYWPTIEQIDEFEKNPDKWLTFCCYLYEKGREPKTNEEHYSKKNLAKFINDHLELIESDVSERL